MNDNPPESGQRGLPGAQTRHRDYAVLGVMCALVIGVYAWSAKSLFVERQPSNDDNSYYNLLMDGFRAGQLNLKCEVPVELAQLADRPDSRGSRSHRVDQHPLTDVSYYHGRLHLYFGMTPAVLVFWPCRELTGYHLFHKDAVLMFFSVGFIASVVLLWGIWQRYFVQVGVWILAACALALGLANFTLLCLPRGGVYEVSISCGYALTMVALALLWQALDASRHRGRWLAAASLACGLSVAARPSLLLGTMVLFVPLVRAWQGKGESHQPRQLWPLFLAATGPITLIGLGLLLYNYMRFENPFEFGEHYMLSWAGAQAFQPQYGLTLFNPGYLWFNFRVYFLELPRWSARFPFVHDIASPSLPPGHAGVDHVFGILPNLPFVWLVAAVQLSWRERAGMLRSSLRWFGGAMVLLFGACVLTLCSFLTAYGRYQVEFLPVLVWLAVLSILGLERARNEWTRWRREIRWCWGLLLAFSVSFNLFSMFALVSDLYASNGVLSVRQGRLDRAIVEFQDALKLQPDNPRACSGLGVVFQQQGNLLAAAAYQEEALRLKPEYPEAQNNLGVVLFELGRVAEAVGHYKQALRFKPDFIDAHYNLGVALAQQGRLGDAINHFEQALRLEPNNSQAHVELGKVLLEQGRLSEAVAHLERCLQTKPGDIEARHSLGTALIQLGKVPEAIAHLEQILRLNPDHTEARNHLAWVLATCADGTLRNGPRAVELAEAVNRLIGGRDPSVLETLAAAYAEAGRFDDAARTARTALGFVNPVAQPEQVRRIENRLQLYKSGQPYHEGANSGPR